MAFKISELSLPGVKYIETDEFADERGFFTEVYKASVFKEAGIEKEFVQINHSFSRQNVLRGLHYQLNPSAQGKMVTLFNGSIFDVAVDIREGSDTYGQWVGREISAEKHDAIYIPEGYAHGFCVLSDQANVVYYATSEYDKESEGGIIWNDPEVGIDWPIDNPVLSEKDANLPQLKEISNNFKV